MMTAAFIIVAMTVLTGMVILRAEKMTSRDDRADVINDNLPQTQCGKCDYAGCRPYAVAILENEADINQCPPGGRATVNTLARLTGAEAKPLNPAHGVEQPQQVAVIDESLCIGCVKCIRACPVDAIVGAAKQMHSVIESECTGCELCVAPCPVDCIDMLTLNNDQLLQKPGMTSNSC